MADFSKQYCEIKDMGFDGDFDIIEEWNTLAPGYLKSFICEGFGFSFIGKLEDDLTQPWLGIVDFDNPEADLEWVKLEDLIAKYETI